MSHPSDPILRALQVGDETCPDGRALASLGRRVREVARPPQPVDLLARVRAGCAEAGAEAAEDALVDEIYDNASDAAAAADPGLARLGALVRQAASPDRQPDLLPRLEGRLSRLSSRRLTSRDLDGATRWRIWTMVVAGHVAALLALAVFNVRMAENRQLPPDLRGMPLLYTLDTSALTDTASPEDLALPVTWSDLHDEPQRLFILRSEQRLRDQARSRFGMDDSAGTVDAATRWLVARQRSDSGAIGSVTGRVHHDLAVQSLAALALLGQGGDDAATVQACSRVLDWLLVHQPRAAVDDTTVGGLLALALVEGGLQLEREDLRQAAEAQLAQVALAPLAGSGSARGGALLLACEIAAAAGWAVPDGLRARAVAAGDEATAVVATQLAEGVHAGMGAVTALLVQRPEPDADARLDLLGWLMPTHAVREVGGLLWLQWAEDLQRALLPAFNHSPDGQAWLPASRVRHAGVTGPAADVFATSLAVLTLQAPYRYLPLEH